VINLPKLSDPLTPTSDAREETGRYETKNICFGTFLKLPILRRCFFYFDPVKFVVILQLKV